MCSRASAETSAPRWLPACEPDLKRPSGQVELNQTVTAYSLQERSPEVRRKTGCREWEWAAGVLRGLRSARKTPRFRALFGGQAPKRTFFNRKLVAGIGFEPM